MIKLEMAVYAMARRARAPLTLLPCELQLQRAKQLCQFDALSSHRTGAKTLIAAETFLYPANLHGDHSTPYFIGHAGSTGVHASPTHGSSAPYYTLHKILKKS